MISGPVRVGSRPPHIRDGSVPHPRQRPSSSCPSSKVLSCHRLARRRLVSSVVVLSVVVSSVVTALAPASSSATGAAEEGAAVVGEAAAAAATGSRLNTCRAPEGWRASLASAALAERREWPSSATAVQGREPGAAGATSVAAAVRYRRFLLRLRHHRGEFSEPKITIRGSSPP